MSAHIVSKTLQRVRELNPLTWKFVGEPVEVLTGHSKHKCLGRILVGDLSSRAPAEVNSWEQAIDPNGQNHEQTTELFFENFIAPPVDWVYGIAAFRKGHSSVALLLSNPLDPKLPIPQLFGTFCVG